MATTTLEAPAGLMTAEEFCEWANQPERGDTLYELENGRVVEMPSPSRLHGIVCWIVATILGDYVRGRKSGYIATNDTGMIIRRSPDTVRGPDILVFLESIRLEDIDTKYVEDVPALVVEVRSPSDRDSKILKRLKQYLQRGVPLVWVVDPEDRVVTTYRDHEFPKVHDETDILEGNGVLPGFSKTVAEFFQLPGTSNGGAA